MGLTSISIGAQESSATAVGSSLQLTGAGMNYEDFFWLSLPANTFGAINTQQRFVAAVPEPATLTLFCLGLGGLGFARRKKA